MLLEEVFSGVLSNYTESTSLKTQLWNEIAHTYCEKSRHYHNLEHLEHFYKELFTVKTLIQNWDAVVLALFYHDVVYDVQSNKNEVESAELATVRLKNLGMPEATIMSIKRHITATKKHEYSNDDDTNYFIDADLSILGSAAEVYQKYAKKIRKEYTSIPEQQFVPARKAALKRFLAMERIFKTQHFFQKYEAAARENLLRELEE